MRKVSISSKKWITRELCRALVQDASDHFGFEVQHIFYVCNGGINFYIVDELETKPTCDKLEGFIDGWLCQYSYALRHLLKERGYTISND